MFIYFLDEDVVLVSEKLPSAALQAKAKSLKLPPTFYNYLDAPPCKGCIGCRDEDVDDFDELIWGPRRGSQRETETPSTTASVSSTSVFGGYIMINKLILLVVFSLKWGLGVTFSLGWKRCLFPGKENQISLGGTHIDSSNQLRRSHMTQYCERHCGSVVECSLMVRKVPGLKSAQGQKYHVTQVLYVGKALYSHLPC